MPLHQTISVNLTTNIYVWKITETFDELFKSLPLKDISLARVEKMKAESHQKGFLAVRKLLEVVGYTDFDLYYDDFGKPNLKDGKQISISHSHDFSVIVVSDASIGVDLEILKEKTLKIAARYMDVSHLENLEDDQKIQKATVVWGIKEAIFKIKNVEGISFKNHIFENPFSLSDKKCAAALHFDNHVTYFDIKFEFIDNYALVIASEKK